MSKSLTLPKASVAKALKSGTADRVTDEAAELAQSYCNRWIQKVAQQAHAFSTNAKRVTIMHKDVVAVFNSGTLTFTPANKTAKKVKQAVVGTTKTRGLPANAVERIVRNVAGKDTRLEADTVALLQSASQEYLLAIGNKARELAAHAGRKGLKADDITLAVKHLRCGETD